MAIEIKDIPRAEQVMNEDLLMLGTSNGTRSVTLEDVSELFGGSGGSGGYDFSSDIQELRNNLELKADKTDVELALSKKVDGDTVQEMIDLEPTILYGSSAPVSTLGKDGDIYIQTD